MNWNPATWFRRGKIETPQPARARFVQSAWAHFAAAAPGIASSSPETKRLFEAFMLSWATSVNDPDVAVKKDANFYETLRQEGYLYTLLKTREAKACRATLEVLADDPKDDDIVEEINRVLFERFNARMWIAAAWRGAVLEGVGFNELVWKTEAGKWWITEVVNPGKAYFTWDEEYADAEAKTPWGWRYKGRMKTDTHGVPLRERPNNFWICANGQTLNRPWGDAMGTPLSWLKTFKDASMRFTMYYIEHFANPHKMAKCETETQAAQCETMFKDMGNSSDVVIPAGVEVTLLQAASSGFQVLKDILEYFDQQMAIVVKGQTLTTSVGETGGAYALGEVHQDTENILFDADLGIIEDAFNQRSMGGFRGLIEIIREVVAPNRPDARVYVKLSPEVKVDAVRAWQEADLLIKHGIDVGKRQMMDLLNHAEMPPDDEPIDMPAPAAPFGFGGGIAEEEKPGVPGKEQPANEEDKAEADKAAKEAKKKKDEAAKPFAAAKRGTEKDSFDAILGDDWRRILFDVMLPADPDKPRPPNALQRAIERRMKEASFQRQWDAALTALEFFSLTAAFRNIAAILAKYKKEFAAPTDAEKAESEKRKKELELLWGEELYLSLPPEYRTRADDAIAWWIDSKRITWLHEYYDDKQAARARMGLPPSIVTSEALSAALETAVMQNLEAGVETQSARELIDTVGGGFVEVRIRTNLYTAYEKSRAEEVENYKDVFAGYIFRPVLDDRTTDSHRHLNGAYFAFNDPKLAWVRTPLFYNCRCNLEPVTVLDEREIANGKAIRESIDGWLTGHGAFFFNGGENN